MDMYSNPMYGGGNYPAAQPVRQVQPMYQPQGMQQSGQGVSSASRVVSSREEAVSIPADFSGALMVLPDVAHNRIYVKRWNYQTGGADFLEFEPAKAAQPTQYITPEMLDERLRQFGEQLAGSMPRGKREAMSDE